MLAHPDHASVALTRKLRRPRLWRVGASLLVVAAFVAPLAVSAPAAGQSLSAQEQLQSADSQLDLSNVQANMAVTRDYLESLADNLKTTADSLQQLSELQDLKPRLSSADADSPFFRSLSVVQDPLRGAEAEQADRYELLSKMYDVVDALRSDLNRTPAPNSNPAMVALSSETAAKLDGLAISWLASAKYLTPLVQDGLVSNSFRRYAGVVSAGAADLVSAVKEISANGFGDPNGVSDLAKATIESAQAALTKGFVARSVARPLGSMTLGADDVVAGVARGLANGNWSDPETMTRLLDGLNRTAAGTVGYLVSDGNPKVAKWFSDTADFAATTLREHTVQQFADAYMTYGGTDQLIREQYDAAQNALAAHHQAPLTIEQYAHNDPDMLRALGANAREVAAARAMAHASAAPVIPSPIEVESRTWTESYRETCIAGACTRINLMPAPATPPDKVGGVRIHPNLVRVEGTAAGVGQTIRESCAHASGAACALQH
jgi:hypothetical protein